jgi:hypothetical protein
LFSRVFYEITVVLDTLPRSKHLSVETCHPLLSYAPSVRDVSGGPDQPTAATGSVITLARPRITPMRMPTSTRTIARRTRVERFDRGAWARSMSLRISVSSSLMG